MPFAPQLSVSNSSVNFGSVNQSTSSGVITVRFTNSGSSIYPPVSFSINPVDTRFTATPNGNFTLNPGQHLDVNFQFNATTVIGSASSIYLGNLSGVNLIPPVPPTLNATTVSGGSTSWGVTPSAINFGSLKVGASAGPTLVTITNNSGSVNLVINSITANPSEFSLSSVPALPATILPGGTITFDVSCVSEFLGFNDYVNGITITPSVGAPQDVELMYTGFAITPAFTLTGATKGVLFGLVGVWDTGPSYSIQQSLAANSPEVAYGWTKQFDFDNTSSNSYLNKVFLRTEPSGACDATLTDTTVLSEQIITKTASATQTGAQDSSGVVNWMQFDLENNGESHKLVFSVAANGGIITIDQLVLAYEPRGTVYESK